MPQREADRSAPRQAGTIVASTTPIRTMAAAHENDTPSVALTRVPIGSRTVPEALGQRTVDHRHRCRRPIVAAFELPPLSSIVNTAAFGPIPSASTATTVNENTGFFASARIA